MASCLAKLQADEACRHLIKARTESRLHQLIRERQSWPSGSLGTAYINFMEANHYSHTLFPNPDFFNNLQSEYDYINYRIWHYHDIFHVVCDMPTTRQGELGLLAFIACQTKHPGVMSILISDMSYLLINKHDQADTLKASQQLIRQASHLARQAKPLFPVPWEEWLPRNLRRIRADLRLERPINQSASRPRTPDETRGSLSQLDRHRFPLEQTDVGLFAGGN